jgi:hypothetical protein
MSRERACLPALALILAASTTAAQQPCFSSTGGPNGDFDWVVHTGEVFFFDTTLTTVIGGPNGAPLAVETCVGGLVEVRNLIIEPGGEIRVQGPNPMRIQASGDVIVRGLLDVSGFNAKDVATLDTGNQVEIGGAGAGGGGRGGLGNPNTTGPSTRGGTGQGPFIEPGAGGEGGESAYSLTSGVDARRPGGGGGGRFAADRAGVLVPTGFSLVASAGTDGNPAAFGAESGQSPPRGGAPGEGNFHDGKSSNDYFGVRPIVGGRGRMVGLLRGELTEISAGSGGGGGGNALTRFPNPNWTPSSDEKGGGGGGGGGALHVQALGKIVFGAQGLIRSNGARGGSGENTNFLDHVGGTGGGGSGGHVVLESALAIDFTDGGTNASALPHDWVTAYGPALKTGSLTYVNPCCRAYSNGGAGGGGVLQLHVPNPAAAPSTDPNADIVVPIAIANQRHPLDGVSSPEAYALFPSCDPFPRAPLGWFGVAGHDARESFVGLALDALEIRSLANEPFPLDIPRIF